MVMREPMVEPARQSPWRELRLALLALFSGAGLFLVVHVGGAIAAHPYFAVEGIDFLHERMGRRTAAVLGQPQVLRQELAEWTGFVPGTSLFAVDAAGLRRRLEAHPWVHRAEVSVQPPRRLVARVRERRALAVVRLDDLHYVDRRGRLIAPVGVDESRDFPIITGVDEGFGRRSVRVVLPRVASLLRRYEGTRWIGAISEVQVDGDGGITVFPMAAQVSIKLGRGAWFAKLARAERVLAARSGEAGQVVMVDLSSQAGVIVRVRDEVAPGKDLRSASSKTEV